MRKTFCGPQVEYHCFRLWSQCMLGSGDSELLRGVNSTKFTDVSGTSCRSHHLGSVPGILLRTQIMRRTRNSKRSVSFNRMTRRNNPQASHSTYLLRTKWCAPRNVLRKLYIWAELKFQWNTLYYTEGNILCLYCTQAYTPLCAFFNYSSAFSPWPQPFMSPITCKKHDNWIHVL
jgi:hypothetical protein